MVIPLLVGSGYRGAELFVGKTTFGIICIILAYQRRGKWKHRKVRLN